MNNTPLTASLELVSFEQATGSSSPKDWMKVALPMCQYCRECEDVNMAAARIIADYANELESVCDPEQIARSKAVVNERNAMKQA
jgi:hypothetical protein